MANTKGSALPTATPVVTDTVVGVDDPGGTPSSKVFVISALHTLYNSVVATLTNKTIDADNNTISNLAIGAEVSNNVGANNLLFDNAQGVSDSNGNEQLRFIETASAINQIRITNAAAGNSPTITGEGDDTNVDLNLAAQGSGIVKIGGSQIATIAGTQTLTNKTIAAASNTLSLTADSVDAITEIAAALKSGADGTLITGTAGTDGDLSVWNGDGDLVDGPTPPTGDIVGTSDTQTLTNKTIDGDNNTVSNLAIGAEVSATLAADLDANANTIAGHEAAINAQTGTTYTLLAADSGKVVTLNNASAITATVGSTIPAGWHCTIVQKGAGQVTVAAGGTGNVRNRSSHTKLAGQYAMGTLFVESNGGTAPEVYLGGDTGA